MGAVTSQYQLGYSDSEEYGKEAASQNFRYNGAAENSHQKLEGKSGSSTGETAGNINGENKNTNTVEEDSLDKSFKNIERKLGNDKVGGSALENVGGLSENHSPKTMEAFGDDVGESVVTNVGRDVENSQRKFQVCGENDALVKEYLEKVGCVVDKNKEKVEAIGDNIEVSPEEKGEFIAEKYSYVENIEKKLLKFVDDDDNENEKVNRDGENREEDIEVNANDAERGNAVCDGQTNKQKIEEVLRENVEESAVEPIDRVEEHFEQTSEVVVNDTKGEHFVKNGAENTVQKLEVSTDDIKVSIARKVDEDDDNIKQKHEGIAEDTEVKGSVDNVGCDVPNELDNEHTDFVKTKMLEAGLVIMPVVEQDAAINSLITKVINDAAAAIVEANKRFEDKVVQEYTAEVGMKEQFKLDGIYPSWSPKKVDLERDMDKHSPILRDEIVFIRLKDEEKKVVDGDEFKVLANVTVTQTPKTSKASPETEDLKLNFKGKSIRRANSLRRFWKCLTSCGRGTDDLPLSSCQIEPKQEVTEEMSSISHVNF